MHSSDSEGFESADEGHTHAEKKGRKQRNSSSNYSDTAPELEKGVTDTVTAPSGTDKTLGNVKATEGWDDFDIDDSEPVVHHNEKAAPKIPTAPCKPASNQKEPNSNTSSNKPEGKSQDTGWDNIDDWGDENVVTSAPKNKPRHQQQISSDKDIKEVTDRLAATSTTPSSAGWGWGWGVDSLLSSATAGLSTITNQVSQGITTVLETGIGAPDPEELAKQTAKDRDNTTAETSKEDENKGDSNEAGGDGSFVTLTPFGSILKFVGNTGTKVINGGLDTLEIIGRKTMEVLQEVDPNLQKKRALLGLDPDNPSLSQVLKEAKAKAEEEDRIKEEKREAKEVHYENLFDDFGGLVHLEALEMLSKQCHFKIEEAVQNCPPNKKRDLKETIVQVAELCELPEEEDDDETTDELRERYAKMPKTEVLHEKLQKATEDLGVKLTFQPLIKQYEEILEWLANEEADRTLKNVYAHAVSSLAASTALAVQLYHRAAEMLLARGRRMVADEADALTRMTVVLTYHITEIANLHSQKITAKDYFDTDAEVKNYVTNIYLVADNSASYVQNALLLSHPILQISVC